MAPPGRATGHARLSAVHGELAILGADAPPPSHGQHHHGHHGGAASHSHKSHGHTAHTAHVHGDLSITHLPSGAVQITHQPHGEIGDDGPSEPNEEESFAVGEPDILQAGALNFIPDSGYQRYGTDSTGDTDLGASLGLDPFVNAAFGQEGGVAIEMGLAGSSSGGYGLVMGDHVKFSGDATFGSLFGEEDPAIEAEQSEAEARAGHVSDDAPGDPMADLGVPEEATTYIAYADEDYDSDIHSGRAGTERLVPMEFGAEDDYYTKFEPAAIIGMDMDTSHVRYHGLKK